MKELSIEEKARRYDGAIKRLEDIVTGKCQKMFMFTEGLFDYIFPELKESEDERIRKELIAFLRENHETGRADETWSLSGIERWIAWLEKQAQKLVRSEEDKNMLKWVIGYLENKMLNTPISEERTACKNAVAWLEEKLKGEQKPQVKYVYTKFRIGDVIVEIKPNGYCQPVRVKHVSEGAYSCESDDGKRFLSFPITSQDEYKLVEQKPVAWSEEDDRMCKAIIDNIKAICKEGYFVGDIGSDKLINWLNSLRFQKQWKPCEEQMTALDNFIYAKYPDTERYSEPIKSLYNDLKKLREEQL